MAWFLFRPQAAVNLDGDPVASGACAAYAPDDTTFSTPLTARDPVTLAPLASIPVVNYVTGAFEVEDHDEVYLKSGAAPAVAVISARGQRVAAEAAQAAAESAQTAAQAAQAAAETAEAAAFGPTDSTVATLFATPGSAVRVETESLFVAVRAHESPLAKWFAALAKRSAAPTQIVVIGDSISEGTGASTLARRWQTALQAALRSRLGASGAEFPFIPAWPGASSVPGWPVTRAGTVVETNSYGLGWRTAVLQNDTHVLTFAFTGTSAAIMFVRSSSTGKLRVTVDGGTPVVVDTNSTSSGQPASNAATWSTGSLTRDAHTIVVTRDTSSAAGQYPYVQGLLTWDGDESAGVRILDASHSGYSSVTMVSGTREEMASKALVGAGGAALAIIAMGTNDTVGPTDVVTYKANIEAMIARLRTDGFAGSVLLLHMYKGGGLDETVYTGFGDQLSAIAASDPDVAFLDLRRSMPDVPTPYSAPASLGLFADSLHPSDAGHGWIADVLASYLTIRV